MSYPLDQLANATQPVTLAGVEYPVRQLKLSEWGELQAWLRSTAPNPVKVAAQAVRDIEAEGQKVPEHVQRTIFAQAQDEARRWPPKVGTMAWLRALEGVEGGNARFLRAALAPGGPVLEIEQAEEIATRASIDEMADLMRVCLHGEALPPKSAGGATAPTTPPAIPTTGAPSSSESSKTGPDGDSST